MDIQIAVRLARRGQALCMDRELTKLLGGIRFGIYRNGRRIVLEIAWVSYAGSQGQIAHARVLSPRDAGFDIANISVGELPPRVHRMAIARMGIENPPARY